MNLKKFISGVSAFAIAASAFAGLAVTANAETYYTADLSALASAFTRTDTCGAPYSATTAYSDGALSFELIGDNNNHPVMEAAGQYSWALDGRRLHFDMTSKCASSNHNGYVCLEGTNLKLYFYHGQIRLHGKGWKSNAVADAYTDWGTPAESVDIVFHATDNKVTYYADGKAIGDVYNMDSDGEETTVDTLTGIKLQQNKGTFKGTIKAMYLDDVTTSYKVTVGGSSAYYFSGASFTLGTSSTGYWTDGTVVYASGTKYTVTGAATITELPADFDVDLGVGTSANGTEDYADTAATWYVAKVTNNGGAGSFSTMTLIDESNNNAEATTPLDTAITLDKDAFTYIGVIIKGGDYTGHTINATVN